MADCETIQYSRSLSWDLCYQYFKSETEFFSSPIPAHKLERAASELATYLAFFGMFRNVEMKAANRRVFGLIISALFQAARDNGIRSYKDLENITTAKLRALITALDEAYVIAFKKTGFVDEHPTDTMISKILMGIFGILPALDANYIAAVRALHRQLCEDCSLPPKTHTTHCLPTTLRDDRKLEFLLDFSRDEDLKAFLKKLVLPAIQDSDNKTIDDYPVMRLLDLYLWVVGRGISRKI